VEVRIVKVKFCQFDLQKFYCTSIVLSGKILQMFRIKLISFLRLNNISINLLCKSKSSQLVYSLRR